MDTAGRRQGTQRVLGNGSNSCSGACPWGHGLCPFAEGRKVPADAGHCVANPRTVKPHVAKPQVHPWALRPLLPTQGSAEPGGFPTEEPSV